MENVERIANMFSRAEVVTVDQGPFLSSWDTGEPEDDEDMAYAFTTTDVDGDTTVEFSLGAVKNAVFGTTGFSMLDTDGQSCMLNLYTLTIVG